MKKQMLLPLLIFLASCGSREWLERLEQRADSLQTIIETMKNKALAPQEWNHKIDWFEIPVIDMDRAKKFYETILGIQMMGMDTTDPNIGPYAMAFFADMNDTTIVSGALVKMNDFVPSDKGTLIYLNAGEDLSNALNQVEPAGGKVIMPKTGIGPNNEHGFMALFFDTEGNKMALHSMK